MADIPDSVRENLIIGLSVGLGSAVLTCIIVLIVLCCRTKRKEKDAQKSPQGPCPAPDPGPPTPQLSVNPSGLDDQHGYTGTFPSYGEGDRTYSTSDRGRPYSTGDGGRPYVASDGGRPYTIHGTGISNTAGQGDAEYHGTSYSERAPSPVESQITSGGVKSVRLPDDYRSTCPPLTMVPFRTQSLAGLPGSTRPSTIAGLPTFNQTNLTWGRTQGEKDASVSRRASDVSSLRAKQMFESDGKPVEHRRRPLQNAHLMAIHGLYRNQCSSGQLLTGWQSDATSYCSELPEELGSDGEQDQERQPSPVFMVEEHIDMNCADRYF